MDGHGVCNKDHLCPIAPYRLIVMSVFVESISELSRVSPVFLRRDGRGEFMEVMNEGPWNSIITGVMNGGAELGHHYHKRTRMYFFLIEGLAEITVVHVPSGDRRAGVLRESEGIFLEPHDAHVIRFAEMSRFILLKSRAYSEADPDTFPYGIQFDQTTCNAELV